MNEHLRRQLVLCFDGTNNNLTGGKHDTHVLRLLQMLEPDAHNQVVYYDPGVGNGAHIPGVTVWDRVKAGLNRLMGLALGGGVYENISQGYRFLVENYQRGDDIFLFGFSRGAFTARSVGGMVARFGILQREHLAVLDTLVYLYFSDAARPGSDGNRQYEAIQNQIRTCFAIQPNSDRNRPWRVPIWFTGVWDTVESVGWPGFRREISGSPTILGKPHVHVRHALALDEFRTQFVPRMFAVHPDRSLYEKSGQSIEQRWFSGAHCDVGGGYADSENGLAEDPFRWMVQEAGSLPRPLRFSGTAPPDKATGQSALRPRNPLTILHSELLNMPLWALTGMQVRNPHHNPLQKLRPADSRHPKAEHHAGAIPRTVDAQTPRQPLSASWFTILMLAVLVAGFMQLHGAVLGHGLPRILSASGHDWMTAVLLTSWNEHQDLLCSNWNFLKFQLSAFWSGEAGMLAWANFPNAADALIADIPLILSYAAVLSITTAWAFSKLARLRSGLPNTLATRALNRLGIAPMYMVIADIVENIATALVVADWTQTYLGNFIPVFAMTMAAACAMKLLALSGCVVLVIWALVGKPKP